MSDGREEERKRETTNPMYVARVDFEGAVVVGKGKARARATGARIRCVGSPPALRLKGDERRLGCSPLET